MKRLKATVDKIVGGVLVLLMALAVLNVLWQVFTRFALGNPSSFTEELARYLLIWVGVLGAGYAVGQRAHLALELLPEYLTGRWRRRLEITIQACMGAFAFFVLVVGGSGLAYVQFYLGQTSPSLNWPLGGVYLVLPISGLLMTFYIADTLVELRARPIEDVADSSGSAFEQETLPGDGSAPPAAPPHSADSPKPPASDS